ncbi:MAG: Methyl-coenzyme M reductase I operon protein C [Candidatus Methanolliviera sp. GoM_oil]|nr:MAG: Methyl-coenzyme M reductase I operon protein C [Candidatus Methanolliviera sp. GoM_oil]
MTLQKPLKVRQNPSGFEHFGRETEVVACREGMGLGIGGGMAQRGTFAEAQRSDVLVLAMSPGRRHITKPVCDITTALRKERIQVSVLVLNSGAGTPPDAPSATRGMGPNFGITGREVQQLRTAKLLILHHGNIRSHVVYKVRTILRYVDLPAMVICQAPVDFEDFAKVGVKTRYVMPKEEDIMTEGTVAGIVSGIIRGQACPKAKLNEIFSVINPLLEEYSIR